MNSLTITAKECYDSITNNESDSHLIDVRMPTEFEQMHATDAQLFPLDSLNPEHLKSQLNISNTHTVYILCHSGARASKAQAKFESAGMHNTVVVEGGTQAWAAANLPVIKSERKTISLQRQVQIAAGSLIVLGLLLAFTVHFSFIALSAFVGCGLIFAGITDTCGMAIFLAKMPWNKPKGCVENCSCSI